MKFRLLLVGALLVASMSSAYAAGPYVAAAGGLSIFHDSDVSAGYTRTISYNIGAGFGVSAGYNFDGPRIEFEFGYRNNNINEVNSFSVSGTDLTVLSYMINGIYDFKTNSPFSPFIGVGLGMVNGTIDVQPTGDNTADTEFGYQAIFGVSYAVNKNLNLDLSYRFQGAASDFKFQEVKVSYMSSNIFAGMRYNF